MKEGQEWGKFLVRSCINLFNLGADGKGVDRTNNLWIVPAVLTYYPRGRWQKRRSKSGKRFGKFLGFESSQGFESFDIFFKTWQEVIDSSASRVRQDIVDSDLVTRLKITRTRITLW